MWSVWREEGCDLVEGVGGGGGRGCGELYGLKPHPPFLHQVIASLPPSRPLPLEGVCGGRKGMAWLEGRRHI